MRKATFLKHINNLEAEDLRSELMMLFSKVKAVPEYYKMELGSAEDRQKMYAKAKQEIAKKFATKSYRKPRRPRIQKVYKMLKDVNDKSVFQHEMIDIYLFTSETAWGFMDDYEFDSTPLHNIIIKTYKNALNLIMQSRMEEDFKERAQTLIKAMRYHRDLQNALEDIFDEVYH